jgi:predicted ArsR family transcriptional regulator
MDDLGFHVRLKSNNEDQSIEACNCIYHDIAQKHPEVCEFDKALINTLLGEKAALVECAAKGGHLCRFVLPVVKIQAE